MMIRIPIATRLLLAFAAVIAVYGGAVALSIARLTDFKATVHSITRGTKRKRHLAEAKVSLRGGSVKNRGVFMTPDAFV